MDFFISSYFFEVAQEPLSLDKIFKLIYESYILKSICAAISFVIAWCSFWISISNNKMQKLKSELDIFDKIEKSNNEIIAVTLELCYKNIELLTIKPWEQENIKQEIQVLQYKKNIAREKFLNTLELICFNINCKKIDVNNFIRLYHLILHNIKDKYPEIMKNSDSNVFKEIRYFLDNNEEEINKMSLKNENQQNGNQQ